MFFVSNALLIRLACQMNVVKSNVQIEGRNCVLRIRFAEVILDGPWNAKGSKVNQNTKNISL